MFVSLLAPRLRLAAVVLVAVAASPGSSHGQEPARTFKVDRSGQTIENAAFDDQDLSDTNFQRCTLRIAGFRGAILQRCSFRGAKLYGSSFNRADMTECDLRNTDLEGAGLQAANLTKANCAGLNFAGASMQSAKLIDADLTKTRGYNDVQKADFSGSDLRGADLSSMRDFGSTPNFVDAKYDRLTRWPAGFDPKDAGAVFVPDPAVPTPVRPAGPPLVGPTPNPMPNPTPGAPVPTNPAAPGADHAAEFFKLDTNQDQFLSGKEAKSLDRYDVDKDGEITLKEYIAGRSKTAKP